MNNTIVYFGKFTENMLEALNGLLPQQFVGLHVKPGDDINALAEADYIINRGAEINRQVIQSSKKLKWIQKWGVGFDQIDIQAAGDKGIPVGICLGGNSTPVAELTIALILNVYRNILPLNKNMSQGKWVREKYSLRSYMLNGKTVGLIGMGNIAQKVAHIATKGFDAKIIYYDIMPAPKSVEERLGLEFVSLDELLVRSDIVSVHVPLTTNTKDLINKEKLSLMKPTAIIINTSRGGIINENDLIEALKSQRILGAGLDTFEVEPLPTDSELLKLESVVTTPHCGGNTVDNDNFMANLCMTSIVNYHKTKDLTAREIVNRDYL